MTKAKVKAKKQKRINTAPSGISFMYEPKPEAKPMKCPGCGKGHVTMSKGGFPTCNEGSVFTCSKKCGWKSPSGNFKHKPTPKQTLWPKRKPVKKNAKR